jgi:hypothetical protein
MGPACTLMIVRVGVTAVLIHLLSLPAPPFPSQCHAIPSTLIYPVHARSYVVVSVRARGVQSAYTCWSFQKVGQVLIGSEEFFVSSQQLKVGDRTARGTTEGRKGCCWASARGQLLHSWRKASKNEMNECWLSMSLRTSRWGEREMILPYSKDPSVNQRSASQ